MTTRQTAASSPERVAYKRLWWVGLLVIIAATVANGLIRQAALALIDVDPGFNPLQSPSFVPLTIIGTGAGVLVYALLGRLSRRPVTTFRIVAAVAFVLSLLPDLGLLAGPMPGATPVTIGVLMLMHAVAAAITVGLLTTLAAER
jgi:hypothetical protein